MAWKSLKEQEQEKRNSQWKSLEEQEFGKRREEYSKLLTQLSGYVQYLAALAKTARGPGEFLIDVREQIERVNEDLNKARQVLT